MKEELHLPLYKDFHHEDNEIIFDLRPRFDEHEDGQGSCKVLIILGGPQNFELKQEAIVQGFERCSTQGGCPYSQQELRAILSQQGEYDAYLLRHYIQPYSSNPFGVTSFQIQVRQDLYSSPLFEFHGKGHFMEFYLNFKMPFSKDTVLDSKCNNLVILII